MNTSLKNFISHLSGTLKDVKKVVISTYNDVESHKGGGQFEMEGRKVDILCGKESHSQAKLLLKDAGPETLAIFYAGMKKLSETVFLGLDLADQGVKVVLISCGCEYNDTSLRATKSHKNIIKVFPGRGCNNGYDDLSLIVEALANPLPVESQGQLHEWFVNMGGPMAFISEAIEKLNDEVEKLINLRPFFVKGNRIGFKDGGKDTLHAGDRIKKMFSDYDMTEAMSWNEPDSMNYMVCNVMRHGLLSYGLYSDKGIMVGSKGNHLYFSVYAK